MHHKQKNILLILVGAGIVLVVGALIVFLEMRILQLGSENQYLANKLNEQKILLSQKEDTLVNPELIPTPEVTTPETGSDTFGNYTLTYFQGMVGKYKDYTTDFENTPIEILWKQLRPLNTPQTLDLLHKVDPTYKLSDFKEVCDTGSPKCGLHIYEIGTLLAPSKLSGKMLYLFAVPAPGMGMYYDTELVFFEETTKQFVALTESTDNLFQPQTKQLYTGAIAQKIASLQIPQTLSIPNSDSYLQFLYSESFPFDKTVPQNTTVFPAESNRGGLYDIEGNKTIDSSRYTGDTLAFTHPQYGNVFLYNRGYHIILPDGSVQIYELVPSFLKPLVPEGAAKNMFSDRFEAKIKWTDGRAPSNEIYMIGGDIRNGGCVTGIMPCTNIVNKNSWFKETNLTPVGTTPSGDSVYELKDQATNAYYKQLFDYGYAASRLYPNPDPTRQTDQPTFTQDQLNAMTDAEKFKDFLLDHPLFFWKDQTGNWRMYQKAKYQSMVECGKPVIYLYPTTETNVHVEVNPQGGFTITEPAYGTTGWDVRATPSGKLTNLADQQAYPYLFWEGIGYNYAKPTQGFVLKRENVQSEMKKILGRLGLNENEQKDFLEFWAPKLETKPFVFVTFVDQKEFDKIAPLTVSPKPDSVIRVFMDYTPLEKEIKVAPLSLKTPERKGFTVVEWGGALHK